MKKHGNSRCLLSQMDRPNVRQKKPDRILTLEVVIHWLGAMSEANPSFLKKVMNSELSDSFIDMLTGTRSKKTRELALKTIFEADGLSDLRIPIILEAKEFSGVRHSAQTKKQIDKSVQGKNVIELGALAWVMRSSPDELRKTGITKRLFEILAATETEIGEFNDPVVDIEQQLRQFSNGGPIGYITTKRKRAPLTLENATARMVLTALYPSLTESQQQKIRILVRDNPNDSLVRIPFIQFVLSDPDIMSSRKSRAVIDSLGDMRNSELTTKSAMLKHFFSNVHSSRFPSVFFDTIHLPGLGRAKGKMRAGERAFESLAPLVGKVLHKPHAKAFDRKDIEKWFDPHSQLEKCRRETFRKIVDPSRSGPAGRDDMLGWSNAVLDFIDPL